MLSSSFEHLLHFLYTDQAPHVKHHDCLGVIELANRYSSMLYFWVFMFYGSTVIVESAFKYVYSN